MHDIFSSPDCKSSKNSLEETLLIFPYKLFDAANLNLGLITWTPNGNAISVDSSCFEEQIMFLHPYLVEIPNFANFRRQMRAYGFSWKLISDDIFEFSHEYFKRYRQDLLKFVLTRRKQMKLNALKDKIDESYLNLPSSVNWRRSLRSRPDSVKTFQINRSKPQRKPYMRRLGISQPVGVDAFSDNQDSNISNAFFTENDVMYLSANFCSPHNYCSPVTNDEYLNNEPNLYHSQINYNSFPNAPFDRLDFEIYHSCLSWMLQHDPVLAREYEVDMLTDCLKNMQKHVDVPIYFYD
ncbi:hypothetical protein HELRODRAFT_172976 [Helobdella robusta]|uniref:HSF-type DNA-binding domain-containing protein n=1 Tax=Helobdella robusta TaxID=6412 RepID=T1F684_HELRO|nr:hypothetical protein HELRODRAFT_172976 [Helobdella robusta]ESO03941.1 hypothetical protein HELRODRAFT_172976 [Helobdella robusta]